MVGRRHALVQPGHRPLLEMPNVKFGWHALTKETAAILTDALVRMPALLLVDFTLPADEISRWFDNDVEALLRNRLCEAPGLEVRFPRNPFKF